MGAMAEHRCMPKAWVLDVVDALVEEDPFKSIASQAMMRISAPHGGQRNGRNARPDADLPAPKENGAQGQDGSPF
jgi:hypothetical protein